VEEELSRLTDEQLDALEKDTILRQIESAHQQARQIVGEAPRSIGAMQKYLEGDHDGNVTPAIAGEASLEATLKQVQQEKKRRREPRESELMRLDPVKLQQRAADVLEQDLHRREEAEPPCDAIKSDQAQPGETPDKSGAVARTRKNKEQQLAAQLTDQRQATTPSATPKTEETFAHSPDYRTVTIHGKTYTLTPRQAQFIEILHRAYESGKPDLPVARILEKLETPDSRWQDTFKRKPEAKKALIKSGVNKGTLRLNL